jgi:hypothetical protein
MCSSCRENATNWIVSTNAWQVATRHNIARIAERQGAGMLEWTGTSCHLSSNTPNGVAASTLRLLLLCDHKACRLLHSRRPTTLASPLNPNLLQPGTYQWLHAAALGYMQPSTLRSGLRSHASLLRPHGMSSCHWFPKSHLANRVMQTWPQSAPSYQRNNNRINVTKARSP